MDYAEALELAHHAHVGQYRKGTRIPYITHPVAVSETLARLYPEDTELHLAALLHDVLEDTPLSFAELERRAGSTLARLVLAVSDQPLSGDYWQRVDIRAVRLKAADLLHNLESILRDLDHRGAAALDKFKNPAATLFGYQHLAGLLCARLEGDPQDRPLLDALSGAARRLFARDEVGRRQGPSGPREGA